MSEGYTQPFNHQINDQVPHPEPGGTLTGTLDQKDTQSTNASSNQKQKLIKARQSFSLKEKMAYVMAYKRDCILAVEGGVNQSPGSPDGKLKKTKLKAWLSEKNAKDGTNIAYGTMYKWFKRYEKMEPHKGDMNLKKLRARPFAELEDILVQYLSVRNKTRRRSGLPPSCPTFIKEKANMFYRDMYGDCPSEAGKDFKCSSGWVHRFKERYKSILEPDDEQYPDHQNQVEKHVYEFEQPGHSANIVHGNNHPVQMDTNTSLALDRFLNVGIPQTNVEIIQGGTPVGAEMVFPAIDEFRSANL